MSHTIARPTLIEALATGLSLDAIADCHGMHRSVLQRILIRERLSRASVGAVPVVVAKARS